MIELTPEETHRQLEGCLDFTRSHPSFNNYMPGDRMSAPKPTETKLARDLVPGDRICYRSGQLHDWADNGYANNYIELSGQVLKVETCFDGRKYILTPSGWLTPLLRDAEVTIAPPDYDVEIVQRQYETQPSEICGVWSID